MDHRVATLDELRAIIGQPQGLAVRKCLPKLEKHARAFISKSPFLCLSTSNAAGRADISPRGDPAGFAQVLDDETIVIPDRPGNNRLDTMTNILENPNVAVIFFIPGIEDTLRVNGKAWITRDPALLAASTMNGKQPKLAICLRVEETFFHCAKALKRSRLWDPQGHAEPGAMPSLARIILEQTTEPERLREEEIAAAEARIETAYKTTLY